MTREGAIFVEEDRLDLSLISLMVCVEAIKIKHPWEVLQFRLDSDRDLIPTIQYSWD
jgi:hypothetical protein